MPFHVSLTCRLSLQTLQAQRRTASPRSLPFEMINLLPFVALGATFFANVASAHTWLGCYGALYDYTYLRQTDNSLQCADLVATMGGYKLSHYISGHKKCYASNNGRSRNIYYQGWPGGCPTCGYETYAINAEYEWQSCPGIVTWNKLDQSPYGYDVNSGADCLNLCKAQKSRYVVTMPWDRQSSTTKYMLKCYCPQFKPSTTHGVCTTNAFFFYDLTPNLPAASGFARRAAAAKRLAEEQRFTAHPLCPEQFQPCAVSENYDDGFECLDTSAELESCGGCRFGLYGLPSPPTDMSTNSTGPSMSESGVNCLQVPGINPFAVTCILGQCQPGGCANGYILLNGDCVRKRD